MGQCRRGQRTLFAFEHVIYSSQWEGSILASSCFNFSSLLRILAGICDVCWQLLAFLAGTYTDILAGTSWRQKKRQKKVAESY